MKGIDDLNDNGILYNIDLNDILLISNKTIKLTNYAHYYLFQNDNKCFNEVKCPEQLTSINLYNEKSQVWLIGEIMIQLIDGNKLNNTIDDFISIFKSGNTLKQQEYINNKIDIILNTFLHITDDLKNIVKLCFQLNPLLRPSVKEVSIIFMINKLIITI